MPSLGAVSRSLGDGAFLMTGSELAACARPAAGSGLINASAQVHTAAAAGLINASALVHTAAAAAATNGREWMSCEADPVVRRRAAQVDNPKPKPQTPNPSVPICSCSKSH